VAEAVQAGDDLAAAQLVAADVVRWVEVGDDQNAHGLSPGYRQKCGTGCMVGGLTL